MAMPMATRELETKTKVSSQESKRHKLQMSRCKCEPPGMTPEKQTTGAKNTAWYTPVDNWPEKKRKAWEKRKIERGDQIKVDSEPIQSADDSARE